MLNDFWIAAYAMEKGAVWKSIQDMRAIRYVHQREEKVMKKDAG